MYVENVHNYLYGRLSCPSLVHKVEHSLWKTKYMFQRYTQECALKFCILPRRILFELCQHLKDVRYFIMLRLWRRINTCFTSVLRTRFLLDVTVSLYYRFQNVWNFSQAFFSPTYSWKQLFLRGSSEFSIFDKIVDSYRDEKQKCIYSFPSVNYINVCDFSTKTYLWTVVWTLYCCIFQQLVVAMV